MPRTQIFEWHKCFVKGHEEVEHDPTMGQPSMRTDVNIPRVNQLVRSDCRLTIQMISEELSLNMESADGNCGVTSHGFSTMTTDNAISVKRILAKKQIIALDHPPTP